MSNTPKKIKVLPHGFYAADLVEVNFTKFIFHFFIIPKIDIADYFPSFVLFASKEMQIKKRTINILKKEMNTESNFK